MSPRQPEHRAAKGRDAIEGGPDCDYLIVGAGSAGCVLAARLSESGQHRVILVEAGPHDRNPWIHIPVGYGRLFDDPKVNWRYESEPEPALNGRTLYQPRGKVLGGTSAINGLVYARGPREDFDHWRQLGNSGWGYDDVLPYFRKSENQTHGPDEFHGVGGPLSVSDQPQRHVLGDAFVQAAQQAGHAFNPDFNGATHEGVGYYQNTARNGRRHSTAVAYLRPARNRANLEVLTEALATRILFSGRRAVGVECVRAGERRRIMAQRGVIVSGGVFNSPQLLELSGIGKADRLKGFGIPVVQDIPGVGENLQDHFMIGMVFRCSRSVTLNDVMRNPLRRATMAMQYALFRSGPMAGSAMYAGAFLRTGAHLAAPDLQLNLAVWSVDDSGRSRTSLHRFPGFNTGIVHLRPDSRGSVHIKSTDPGVPPAIRFEFFQSDNDRETMVRAFRIVRNIMRQPAIAHYVEEELTPGRACEADADILAFCRDRGRSCLHPASTCKMGSDAASVVDARLRVRGVSNLYIVDGSIMPVLVGSNPNAATIMIAEKGADMILEDGAIPTSVFAPGALQ